MRNGQGLSLEREKLLNAMFTDYRGKPFAVRLWDGWQWTSSLSLPPTCTVAVDSPAALRTLLLHPNEVALGEAFIEGEVNVEGDIFSVFDIAEHAFHSSKSYGRRMIEAAGGILASLEQMRRKGPRHSEKRDSRSISYHYDQPIEFYQPWLGETLAYSCAYFHSPTDCLDEAQHNKFELICRKLRLQEGERFLDIGCGWGGLILHATQLHGAKAHGVTISRTQAAVVQKRITAAHLDDGCTVSLTDYRRVQAVNGGFDKIASVGMFEHVGLSNLGMYMKKAYALLRPGGLFLNHGIAHAVESDSFGPTISPMPRKIMPRGWRQRSFIDKYVFPDGELVTISQAMSAAEAAGFEVRDVENLREHYELTLRCWAEGLRRQREALLQLVPEKTYRIWLLYIAGCAAAFHRGDIAVYQMLLSRPVAGCSHLPLTREDIFQPSNNKGDSEHAQ